MGQGRAENFIDALRPLCVRWGAMRRSRFCLFFASSLLLATACGVSQTTPAPAGPSAPASAPTAIATPKTPAEFFARARQLSDLEAAGIPFHLKATYVAAGKTEFTGNGTYEEWWRSDQLWRKEVTLENFRYLLFKRDGKTQAFATGSYVPLRLRQAMNAAVIRIPDADATSTKGWKEQSKNIEGLDMDVVSGVSPCDLKNKSSSCLKADYFTQSGVLRVAQYGLNSTVYNKLQPFQGHLIPREIWVTDGKQRILTVSVDRLEPLSADRDEPWMSRVDPQTSQAMPMIGTGSQSVKTRSIDSPPPVYPMTAKRAGKQGIVLIDAQIDDKGNVREPFILQSAGSDLDEAALQAVGRWRYEPITYNGMPVLFETQITIIFKLNR